MDEESQGENSGGTTTSLAPDQLKEYFGKLLPLVLGAEGRDLETILWSNETTEVLESFINEPQVNVVYFTKKRKDRKEEGKIIFLY